MINVKPAKDLKEMRRDDRIWSIAMMIRELATFKGTDKLVSIHELNIQQGYNHIVIETPDPGKPVVIARTSSVEGIVEINQDQFAGATVMDLIYELADLLKEMVSD